MKRPPPTKDASPQGWRSGKGSQGKRSQRPFVSAFRSSERRQTRFSPLPSGKKGLLESPSNPDSHQRLPPVKRKTSLHLATAARHVLASSFAPSLCSSSCLAALDAGGKKGWTLLSIKMFNSEDQLPPHLPRDQRCWVAIARRQARRHSKAEARKSCAPSFEARALVRPSPLFCPLARSLKTTKKGGKICSSGRAQGNAEESLGPKRGNGTEQERNSRARSGSLISPRGAAQSSARAAIVSAHLC